MVSDDLLALMNLPAMTPSERKRLLKKPKKDGLYAAFPGTGPQGETCGSCKHIMRERKYRKCELTRKAWTRGPGTDIKARAPACKYWERVDEKP